MTDALGYLVGIVVLPGQAHDLKGLPELIEGRRFDALIADRAFDADWLVEELGKRKTEAVIPSRKGRKEVREHDREMYRWRHLIDSFFAKVKEFRAVATRYDRTESSFRATFLLADAVKAAR